LKESFVVSNPVEASYPYHAAKCIGEVERDIGAFTKRWIIRKRRSRREKIDKLRKRYAAISSDAERNTIIKKARRVSPQMSVEEFLGPIQRGTKAE
jgi:hypothetical protein